MIRWHSPGPRKGADFLVHVDPQQLKVAGVEVVAMYLKNTTKEQVKAYHDAGLSVLLIHQRGYEGKGPNPAAAGAAHGAEAANQARALGYPSTLPIIFASMGDYDNTDTTIPGSVSYWNAARKAAAAGGYPKAGVYGDWDLLARIGANSALNCQTAAKSWSFDWVARKWRGVHPTAHMVQYPSKVAATPVKGKWFGVAIDPLDLVKQVPAWAPGAPPVSKPVPVPKPTLRYRLPNMTGLEVRNLQAVMKFWGWHRGVVDGKFGRETASSVARMQTALKVPADKVYGPVTAAALQRFATAMKALAEAAK